MGIPAEAYLVSLLKLSGMGPARLEMLLKELSPRQSWQMLINEIPAKIAKTAEVSEHLAARWAAEAATEDVEETWRRHCEAAVTMIRRGGECYPWRLSRDSDAPSVLFAQGDPSLLDFPLVTIVGTRTCTRYGAEVAFELGKAAASRGVGVVSGLALGIDAAAHSGALEVAGAAVVGVVGSGLDRIYPKGNASLWGRVRERGLLLSECPLGTMPERWRFPARNRIMASFADVCVVVESHVDGGALTTAVEAAKRGRVVMAVPGPIRSPASAGTNRLIADGCGVICEIDDLFVVMDVVRESLPSRAGRTGAGSERQASSDPEELTPDTELLSAFEWMPATLSTLAERTTGHLGDVACRLERLIAEGKVVQRGLWYERSSLA